MNKEKLFTVGLGVVVGIFLVMPAINFFYPLLGITISGITPLIVGGVGFLVFMLTLVYFISRKKDFRLFLLTSLSVWGVLSIWTTFSILSESPVWRNEEGAIIVFCTAPCAIVYIIGAILLLVWRKSKGNDASQLQNNQQ